jgi:hypothetical protein
MQETVSSARTALKYGAITGVAVIVYSTVINIIGMAQNRLLTSLAFLILVVGIILALKDYRQQNTGFISYGEGLGTGMLIAAIVGLLASFFTLFYIEFIDNSLLQESLDLMRAELENKGKSETEIEQAMVFAQKFMSPGFMFLMGIFSYLITGFIISLIVAAVMRKEKPVFD